MPHKLLDFVGLPAFVGGWVLALGQSAVYLQTQAVVNDSGNVSFSAAEIALIGVIFSPIVAAITLLFKSLLHAKDETIRMQSVVASALQLQLNEANTREVTTKNELVQVLSGALRENRDSMTTLITGVERLNDESERRHNEFMKFITFAVGEEDESPRRSDKTR